MGDCSVCLLSVEDDYVSCALTKCAGVWCVECITFMIDHCHGEGIIPKCIVCKTYVIRSKLHGKINEASMLQYNESCLAEFTKEKGADIQKAIEMDKVIERIRAQRAEFLKEKFPAAIVFVAKTAMASKMRAIEKAHKAKIAEKSQKAGRRSCMLLSCRGYLDDDFTCMSCTTKFCRACEESIEADHKCDPTIVMSVAALAGFIQCPGCKVHIQKSYGCNGMTCSNCKTTFNYVSGEISSHGSSNMEIQLKSEFAKLTTMFKDRVDQNVLKLLLQAEGFRPTAYTMEMVLNPVRQYLKAVDQNGDVVAAKYAAQLAKNIDAFVINSNKQRDYQRMMIDVEKIITKHSSSAVQAVLIQQKFDEIA